MAYQAIVNSNFSGGWSTDPRLGVKSSQAYTQALDFRKSPSQMSVLPATTREDKGVLKDLVLNEVMAATGQTYSCGNAGYLYTRTPAGLWSDVGKMSAGTAGLDYRKDTDAVYATSNRSVSYIGPITPTITQQTVFQPDFYAESYSTYNNSAVVGFNVAAYQVGSSQSASPVVAATFTKLDESAQNVRYFQSDIEPLTRISLFITDKGNGGASAWTVQLHDGLNNYLGAAQIVTGNIKVNDWNDFVFDNSSFPGNPVNGQVRIYPAPNARTYHLHIMTANGTGAMSSTSTNISDCDLKVWADRMVITNNGLHPIQRFLEYECIGNGNYLSVWEPLSTPPTNDEWLRHRLAFPSEYEVGCLTVQNEFLLIGAGKNTILNTSNPQEGIIFFWDGYSPSYNYFVKIPEGTPQALHTYKNVAYYYCNGDWYGITSPNTTPVKIRKLPSSDTEFTGPVATPITIYPYAATIRRGIQLMAYPSVCTSSTIPFGVYSWGSVDKNFPDTFGLNYVISTGSQNYSVSNNLQIGMVQAFGDLLHVSWRDDLNGGYGIDVITNASPPAAYAKWTGLTYDGGYPAKYKTGLYVECYYYIPDNVTITLSYQIDNGAFVTDTNQYSNTSKWQGQPNYCRFNITGTNGGRFHEITPQVEVRSATGVTVPAVIQMVTTVIDNNNQERLS